MSLTGLAAARARAYGRARGAALLVVGGALWALWRDTPYSQDVLSFAVPNAAYLRERMLQGELARWNPYVLGGHPFLAEIQTQVLYPLSAFWLVFSPLHRMGGFLSLHLGLGAWGAFEWARACRLRAEACATAALAFGLSPLIVEHFEHPNLLCALVWAPWVAWAAIRLARRPTPRRAAVLGAAWALTLLGGAPEYSAFAALGAGWVLRRRPVWGALAAGLGTLAFAAEGVPFVELVRLSERAAGETLERICKSELYPSELVDLVAPFTAYSSPEHSLYFMQMFLGVSPGLLALRARGARALGLCAGVTVLLVLALGNHTPLYPWLWTWVPGVKMLRFPVKYVGMAAAVLAAAAAFGAHRGVGRFGRGSGAVAPVLFLLGMALIAAGYRDEESPWLASLAWVAVVTGLLAAAARLRTRRGRAWAEVAVLAVELAAFQGLVTRQIVAAGPACPDEPLLHAPGRVLFALGPDGVPSRDDQTALCELGMANRNQLSHQLEVNGFVVPGPGAIRRLVREDIPGAFALFHPSVLVVSEQTPRGLYPTGEVLLKRGRYSAMRVGPPVRALWREGAAERALAPLLDADEELAFDLPGTPGTLRVLDTYFPGWEASLDGAALPIRDAGGVREVDVPAGGRRLTMRYAPRSLRWGAALSLAAVVVLLLMGVEPRWLRGRVTTAAKGEIAA